MVLGAGVAFAATSAPALGASAGEPVSGTTPSVIALTASAGATFLSAFSPGNTPTAAGSLTATDTNPGWTLQAADTNAGSSNKGHMLAGATGCAGSDASLVNALNVNVTTSLSGVTSAGQVAISGTAVTVSSATSALMAANPFVTHYSVVIPATEVMLSGCVYSMTATYTLQ
jgi:hypothetical protein